MDTDRWKSTRKQWENTGWPIRNSVIQCYHTFRGGLPNIRSPI